MEKIIHFTVRDPENPSLVESDVIERARKLHPTWEIKIWGDPAPGETHNFFLERYWQKAKTGAQFADLLRLDVLYRFGGVYVDSDLKLFRPLDDLVDRFEFFIASENGNQLTNSIFGARRESPVIRQLIDALNNTEPDWTLPGNITTGPYFFSEKLKWCKDMTVLPRESFYTYGALFEGQKKIHRHSHGEHLWAYSWKPAEANPPLPSSHEIGNAFRRLRQPIVAFIKKHLKHSVVFGFNIWHRLRSLDPMRPLPGAIQRSYQCSDELVVQTIHGYKIVVDGRDMGITPELVFNGFYELAEQYFLKNIIMGGDWVIDVGANIGTLSLLAAQLVGSFGRVFAFEPNPRPSTLMAKSLVMNWMHERVIQRPVAVGEGRGSVKLTFVPDRSTDGQVAQDAVTGSSNAETVRTLGQERAVVLEVPCVCLDEEFPVDLPIKLLKIDVEGYEGRVLAGAERLLRRRCVDFIIMELLPEASGSRWQETVKQVDNVISYGYAVCTLTEGGEMVEQRDLAAALRTGCRNIALVAREQYRLA